MSDRATHRKIAADVEKLLGALGSKYGGEFKLRRGTFDPKGGDEFKIEFAPFSTSGVKLDKEASSFIALGHYYGFTKAHLGENVTLRGLPYRIVGLSQRKKQPILVERLSDGKRYWWDDKAVRVALGLSEDGHIPAVLARCFFCKQTEGHTDDCPARPKQEAVR